MFAKIRSVFVALIRNYNSKLLGKIIRLVMQDN